jgi:hypothetical protein
MAQHPETGARNTVGAHPDNWMDVIFNHPHNAADGEGTLTSKKWADEFGQYNLHLKCKSCLHERCNTPNMLAILCEWDAKLADVARPLRCSVCGQKKCVARASALATFNDTCRLARKAYAVNVRPRS